jgi:murein DD-endopeptidase MepM/ murein hydrolase activator NlpD
MRWIWILIVILGGSLTGYLFTRFETSDPVIQGRVSPVFIGGEHVHQFRLTDKGTGIETSRIWLTSGDAVHELLNEQYPGNIITGAALNTLRLIEVTVRPKELGLSDGPATLFAEARDYSWLGNTTVVQVPLVIDTRAPKIQLITGLTYVRHGGAEAVAYRVNEEQVTHGVQLGDLTFPGFPHPDDPSRNLAFYSLPPSTESGETPQVVATDRAGNRSAVRMPIAIIERSTPEVEIQLSDSFMEAKVSELLGNTNGEVLDGYLKINREMRAENAAKIREICQESSPDRLWRGPFRQLPNSNVGARFAEKRSYIYKGRNVDSQMHLGYDLASTAHAPIPASNDGVVVFADTLGIYGNTVILDHGLGLFSLYGHLSEFAVEKGQAVAAGEALGATGTTGLAGGDHLHFSIMISGIFTDPLEWLDERWIQEHIEPKFVVAEDQNP